MKIKAVSPVTATVILIAITLVAAVAIAGFVFGLFGSFADSRPSSCDAGKGMTTSTLISRFPATHGNWPGSGARDWIKVGVHVYNTTLEGQGRTPTGGYWYSVSPAVCVLKR